LIATNFSKPAKGRQVQKYSDMTDHFDVPPQLNDDLSNIIVVDGIPVIGMDKVSKLQARILKDFKVYGNIVEEYVDMPVSGEKSCG
jgi:hypothetical protein